MSNMHPTLELALSELKNTTSMIVKTIKSNSDRKFPKKALKM